MSQKLIPVPPAQSRSPARSAKSVTITTALPEYERHVDAQGRALQKWEKQQAEWERSARHTTAAAGKSDGASLAASTYAFRERIEESGKLDAAVPPAARSHASNSWEMNLRNGASATRYEPVGSSYPYPLYCPIRSPDQISTEHPNLMHVIYPPEVTQNVARAAQSARGKPLAESQFFKARQAEFASQISKRFAHFAEREYFDVRGEPAPRTAERIDEDPGVAPVVFIPVAPKDGGSSDLSQQGTHAMTIRNLIAQQQLTAPASPSAAGGGGGGGGGSSSNAAAQQASAAAAVVASAKFVAGSMTTSAGAPLSQATIGPQLVLSTNNLSFTTSVPGEIKQAVVTLENTGSTAIYYNWSALPAASAILVAPASALVSSSAADDGGTASSSATLPPATVANAAPPVSAASAVAPSAQLQAPFTLANPVTGSILPDAVKMFCFSFRAPAPGIFTQHMELVTVPCGRERIVVTLRGVGLGADTDPVLSAAVDQATAAMAKTTAAAMIVRADILHNVVDNVFAVSDAAVAVRRREAEIQAVVDAPTRVRGERKAQWARANAAVALPFCEAAYAALETIRGRCSEFRSEFEAVLAPSKRKPAAAVPAESTRKLKESAATPRARRGDDEDLEPPPDRAVQLAGAMPEPWSGSLRALYEDVGTLRTQAVRVAAADAVAAIHRGLAAAQLAATADFDTRALSDIVWLAAGRSWLGAAFEKFDRAFVLAAARVDGRAICVSKGINVYGNPNKKGAGSAGGGGGGGGGGPAERGPTPQHGRGADLTPPTLAAGVSRRAGGGTSAAAALAAVAKPAANTAASGAAASSEREVADLRFQAAKQLLIGAVMGMIGSHATDMAAIEAATVLPLASLVQDEAEHIVEWRDLEAEPQLDLNTKKRK